MNLFYQPFVREGKHFLDPEESRHCIKVLRKRPGDAITVVDGKGIFYESILTGIELHQCRFNIVREIQEAFRTFNIHIAVAPTKNTERIEWFVEKATEFGIDRITFVQCDHSERVKLKLDRIERIAINAMKQSLKATLPAIETLIGFKDFVEGRNENGKFIAYVDAGNQYHLKDLATPASAYCVLIGPEGDFSDEEISHAVNHGFQKVSLGKSRLRTETAALAACHTLNLLNL
ncbi:MAG TPA: 16S rRNA (uracil(1498)-N(3))-methyltransferase [Cyclobacteriaceae bacterium]|nr:16S rRNA (uracil(1498)-N(3))-methyltransferase [Cyclobacteriaceae bacterium]